MLACSFATSIIFARPAKPSRPRPFLSQLCCSWGHRAGITPPAGAFASGDFGRGSDYNSWQRFVRWGLASFLRSFPPFTIIFSILRLSALDLTVPHPFPSLLPFFHIGYKSTERTRSAGIRVTSFVFLTQLTYRLPWFQLWERKKGRKRKKKIEKESNWWLDKLTICASYSTIFLSLFLFGWEGGGRFLDSGSCRQERQLERRQKPSKREWREWKLSLSYVFVAFLSFLRLF